jgi:low affinity Fe/Cu permease
MSKSSRKPDVFTRFTGAASTVIGRPWAFIAALGMVLLWAMSGPILGFSDTWQLIINTSTTLITFLIVFIIQNTQNRDNLAMNIKQDAIMKKLGISAKDLLEAEDDSDTKLENVKARVQKTNKTSRRHK